MAATRFLLSLGILVRLSCALRTGLPTRLVGRTSIPRRAATGAQLGGPADAAGGLAEDAADDFAWAGRSVTVVTTAALPWMTGTSVNPLQRAVELAKRGVRVALLLPWLDPGALDPQEGQAAIYGAHRFARPGEQETWIREWVRGREADEKASLGLEEEAPATKGASGGSWSVHWYPGRYCPGIGSIIHDARPMRGPVAAGGEGSAAGGEGVARVAPRSILDHLPSETAQARDLCILEEPEHLSWYHAGGRWGDYYGYVVGVLHTDYMQYARAEGKDAKCKERVTFAFQNCAYRAHCDKVVALSAALTTPSFESAGVDSGAPKGITVVANVHGVRGDFLAIGRAAKSPRPGDSPTDSAAPPLYFLAKKLWSKGYRELLDLLGSPRGLALLDLWGPIALVGSGPEEGEIARRAVATLGPERVRLLPACDHADFGRTGCPRGEEAGEAAGGAGRAEKSPQVFVNPSRSEVLCTATAEAIAMGKLCVLPDVPANDFFLESFPDRVFAYQTADEFLRQLEAATLRASAAMPAEEAAPLTWAAATARLEAAVGPLPPPRQGGAVPAGGVPRAAERPGAGWPGESWRPTGSVGSRLAHQVNLFFRFGLVGRVMHYDMYMVLEEWDERAPAESWGRALRYLAGLAH